MSTWGRIHLDRRWVIFSSFDRVKVICVNHLAMINISYLGFPHFSLLWWFTQEFPNVYHIFQLKLYPSRLWCVSKCWQLVHMWFSETKFYSYTKNQNSYLHINMMISCWGLAQLVKSSSLKHLWYWEATGSILSTLSRLRFVVEIARSDPFRWICLVQIFCGCSGHWSHKWIPHITLLNDEKPSVPMPKRLMVVHA